MSIKQEQDEVKEEIKHEVHRFADTAKEGLATASEKMQDLKEKAQEKGEEIKDQMTEVGETVNEYVRKNPWSAMAIVGLAGIALGAIMAGKNRDRH